MPSGTPDPASEPTGDNSPQQRRTDGEPPGTGRPPHAASEPRGTAGDRSEIEELR